MTCCAPIAGLALPAGQHPDLDPSKVAERPRVLYNDATQRFVMWLHVDTADYELASCGMATSSSPAGQVQGLGSGFRIATASLLPSPGYYSSLADLFLVSF